MEIEKKFPQNPTLEIYEPQLPDNVKFVGLDDFSSKPKGDTDQSVLENAQNEVEDKFPFSLASENSKVRELAIGNLFNGVGILMSQNPFTEGLMQNLIDMNIGGTGDILSTVGKETQEAGEYAEDDLLSPKALFDIGAVGGISNLFFNVGNQARDLAVGVVGKHTDIDFKMQEIGYRMRDKADNLIKDMGLDKQYPEWYNQFAKDLGGVTGSVMTAIGLGVVGGSIPVGTYFGLLEKAALFKEATQTANIEDVETGKIEQINMKDVMHRFDSPLNGIYKNGDISKDGRLRIVRAPKTPREVAAVTTLTGTLNGAVELVTTHLFLKSLKSLKATNFMLKTLIAFEKVVGRHVAGGVVYGLMEGSEEAIQDTLSITTAKMFWDRPGTFKEHIAQVSYSFLLGTIGGVAPGVIRNHTPCRNAKSALVNEFGMAENQANRLINETIDEMVNIAGPEAEAFIDAVLEGYGVKFQEKGDVEGKAKALKEAAADQWAKIRKLIPEGYQVFFTDLMARDFRAFTDIGNRLIVLMSDFNEQSIPHEAFHIFFNEILTEEGRMDLLTEAYYQMGSNDIIDGEEFICNQFSKFWLGDDASLKTVGGKIERFIRNIRNTLRAFATPIDNLSLQEQSYVEGENLLEYTFRKMIESKAEEEFIQESATDTPDKPATAPAVTQELTTPEAGVTPNIKTQKKTNITPEELMRRNKWIKTKEQAEKIINDINTKPSISLDEVIKNGGEIRFQSKSDEYAKVINDINKKIRELVELETETLKDLGEGIRGGEVILGDQNKKLDSQIKTSLPPTLKHPRTGNKPTNDKQWKELAQSNLRKGLGYNQEEYDALLSEKEEVLTAREEYEKANAVKGQPSDIKEELIERVDSEKKAVKDVTAEMLIEDEAKRQLVRYSGLTDSQLLGQGLTHEEIKRFKEEKQVRSPKPQLPDAKKMLVIPEKEALKIKYRYAEQSAKYGYKAGWHESKKIMEDKLQALNEKRNATKAIKDELKALVFEYVPRPLRGDFWKAVDKTTLNSDLSKLYARMERVVDSYNRKRMLAKLKSIIRRIKRTKAIAVEYKNEIKALLDGIILGQDAVEKALGVIEKVIAKNNQDERVDVLSMMAKATRALSLKPVSEMTNQELKNLIDKVTLLENVGKEVLKDRKAVYESEKKMMLEGALQGEKTKLETKKADSPKLPSDMSVMDNLKERVRKLENWRRLAGKASLPMRSVFEIMGEGLERVFYHGFNQVFSDYKMRQIRLVDKTMKLIEKLKLTQKDFERIGVYGAFMQENGMAKLINTLKTDNSESSVAKAEAYINKIVSEMTKEQLEFYEFMRSELDAILPELRYILAKVYNIPINEVKNYFPFLTDWNLYEESEIADRLRDPYEDDSGGFKKKNVETGFAKERKDEKGKQKIRIDALDTFMKHMDHVLYAIHCAEQIRLMTDVAKTDEFLATFGDMGQRLMTDWTDTLARKGGAAGQKMDDAWKLLLKVARNQAVTNMGLNPSSILVQTLPLVDAAGYIGKYAFLGAFNITNADWRNFVMDNSSALRSRIGDDAAFREYGDSWIDKFAKVSMQPLRLIDQQTAVCVFIGAYTKYCDDNNIELDLKKPNKEGILYAEEIVAKTQASAEFKDLPLMLTRGTGFVVQNKYLAKAAAQYQTPVFYRWANFREALRSWRKGEYKKAAFIASTNMAASFGEFSVRAGFKYVFWPMVFYYLTGAIPKKKEGWDLFMDLIATYFGNIPYGSNLISMVEYGTLPVPAIAAFQNTFNTFQYALRSKSPEKQTKWLTITAIQLSSAMLPLPLSSRVIQGMKRADSKKSKSSKDGKI